MSAKPITEIRRNPDGSLDEVVTWGHVYLEQMSATNWSLILDTVDGQRLVVRLWSKATVRADAELEGPSDLATPCLAGVRVALTRERDRINRNRKLKGLLPFDGDGL